MINNIVLTGRMTKEVDLRYTQSGVAVGSFNLAVERPFKTQGGERETDFINCIIWRKAAENFANFTRKGSLVGIEGRIQTRNYENQQGQRVYVTEIVVENFTLLESRSVTEERPRETSNQNNKQAMPNQNTNQKQPNPSQQNKNANHSNQYTNNQDPFLSNGQSIDISDDDLPF